MIKNYILVFVIILPLSFLAQGSGKALVFDGSNNNIQVKNTLMLVKQVREYYVMMKTILQVTHFH